MRKLRKLLGIVLGLSIIGTVSLAGTAETVSVASDADGEYTLPIGAQADMLFTDIGDVSVFRDKQTEAADLTGLTPEEHNEYFDGELYIVEDIYVSVDEPSSASTSAASEWESKKVTVQHAIFDNPSRNYGTLYATMSLTVKFEYNGTTTRVAGVPSYCTYHYSSYGLDISTKEFSYKSDQGSNIFFGNKYAYAEHVINISNFPKSLNSSNTESRDFRLCVSMNRNGEMHTDD